MPNKKPRLVMQAKEQGLAAFSYNGFGLAVRLTKDSNIDDVFDAAKASIKKQMDKEMTDAIQKHKTTQIHVRKTPQDGEIVGKKVRKQDTEEA